MQVLWYVHASCVWTTIKCTLHAWKGSHTYTDEKCSVSMPHVDMASNMDSNEAREEIITLPIVFINAQFTCHFIACMIGIAMYVN